MDVFFTSYDIGPTVTVSELSYIRYVLNVYVKVYKNFTTENSSTTYLSIYNSNPI